ncbi:MAG: transketolase C-terminal domain-containing protein, partial [Clostridia bacterium]
MPGKANKLRCGKHAAIIACGVMVYPSLEAAKLLSNSGVEASVYDMHTLRPLDEAAILDAAETGFAVTVEEHDVHGGLG